MKPTIFVLNGPNLNMLGSREPNVYGTFTLADLETRVKLYGESLGFTVDCRHSNHEGVLIDWIQEARAGAQGIVLNAGGYTHTSVAIADAIRAAGKPTIEVHISNIHARETYRHQSFISPVAAGVIAGLGIEGYEFALQALAARVVKPEPNRTMRA